MSRLPCSLPTGERALASGVFALLLLAAAGPPLAAVTAVDDCCTGACEDGCCLLGEKGRQRLHREPGDTSRHRPRRPAFEAQAACPEDCSDLPEAVPLLGAPAALSDAPGFLTASDAAAPGGDGWLAGLASWRPDTPRGPPSSVPC